MSPAKRSDAFHVSRQEAEARMKRAGWPQWEIDEEIAEMFGGMGRDGSRVMGSLEILAENSRLHESEGRFREPIFRL